MARQARGSARLVHMRADVNDDEIVQAVVKAIDATFDRSKWMELGLLTNTLDYIQGHRRLLRSLDFGDTDYLACIIEAVPVVLGRKPRRASNPYGPPRRARSGFANLLKVEEYLKLPSWLREREPALYNALYGGEDDIVDELQATAARLGIQDVDEHAARIRRGLREDPAQAIGSAKELLETVLKAVLELHGNGPETKVDVPKLVKEASVRLGLNAGGHRGDEPGAEQRRRLFTALGNIVNATAELRNAGFGTGHGGSQRPALDGAAGGVLSGGGSHLLHRGVGRRGCGRRR